MEHDLSKLEMGIEELGIEITREQLQKFDRYIALLIQWNKVMNLTAIVEPEEIIVDHFLDSLSILKEVKFEGTISIIDVGTGAGFPGVPIKIMKPDIQIVLLDSLRKRTEFLSALRDELQLEDIEIIHSRAEDLARKEEYREHFDFALSRAVAPLNILAEYCMPFIKKGGLFISYKGPAAQDEMEKARKAMDILGGKDACNIKDAYVPYSDKTRKLILVKKITLSPKKYPRSPGKIKKSPL